MLEEPGIIVAPGAYDALSAKIVEKAGFKAIQHTGYGTAASLLGVPDIGLVDFREMCDKVKSIANSVKIPVIGDADTGYGNPINVYRTVKEYINAGADGLFIEDQVWPKKCGLMLGKMIVDKEEMTGKIMAAVDAKKEEDPDFVVGARTDAIAVAGIEEAIERAEVYRKAGADFIYIEGFENIQQMKKAVKEVKAPLMLDLIEGGKTPLISIKEAKKMGFKIVIFPLTALYAATKAIMETLSVLKKKGSALPYSKKLISFSEFNEMVELKKFKLMENKYIPEKILKLMYEHEEH
jgi:methylisocitrate lyase